MADIVMTHTKARGRALAAARYLLGLDQETLGSKAKISGGTVSNVEQGKDVKDITIKMLRRVLRRAGVTMNHDTINNRIVLVIDYRDPDEEDDGEDLE
jgi:transcriptional regulator with XRE-family HTH domain